MTKNKT